MPKSPKGKFRDDEEHPPVTQYFNFPEAWVKDYDPQVHGYMPEKYFRPPQNQNGLNQPGQLPLNPGQQPVKGQPQPQPQPPGYPPGQNLAGNNLQPSFIVQNQWNPNGVYGGLPEKTRSAVPWWAWVIIVLLVLVVVMFALSILRLYPSF